MPSRIPSPLLAAAVGGAALIASAIWLLRPARPERPDAREVEVVRHETEETTRREPPSAAQEDDDLPVVSPAGQRTPPLESPADEPTLMAELRRLMFSDPAMSLRLARDGNSRFSDSPHAPERAWFETRVLVLLGRFDEARAVASRMVERYPGTDWTTDVRRHLLSHPAGVSSP